MSASTKSSVVRLLRELIAIPSVNPAFLPEGDPRGGEGGMVEAVSVYGRRMGWEVELQEVTGVKGERRNVLLRCAPSGVARHRILLAPHLDTVGSMDGSDEVFRPRLAEGRVWGRGACDTKGSVAAMLVAMQRVCGGTGRPASTEVVLAGLADEESHQWGSRALVGSGFRADLGVVGEPTRLAVVTAHKGDVWVRLTTAGRAAHGACPDRGRSAIREMARAVLLLEGAYAEGLRARRHPALGHPTINVGVIRGGTQPNIVPDRCQVEVDRRMVPGETPSGVRREMVGFLRGHGIRVGYEDVKGVPEPALETDEGLPWVGRFLRAAGRRRGRGVDYFCDAAILAAGGTPCVVFGPGDIAQAHTAREWISVASLERATDLLTRFLKSLP